MHHAVLLWLATTALADHPPGTTLDPAVTVDVTPVAFASLASLVAPLVPASIPIPDVNLADSEETCIDLWFDVICWNWYEYELRTRGLDVGLTLDRLDLLPRDGRLELDLGVSLSVASAAAPGTLYARGEVVDLIEIEESCRVWLDRTPIAVRTAIALELSQGTVNSAFSPVDVQLDLSGLRIEGCVFEDILDFIEVINDVVGFFGFDLYTLVADAAEPLVEQQINGLLPPIARTLEDALGSLQIEETIDLGGAGLDVSVAPSTLDVTPEGLRLGLAGGIAPVGNPAACISRYLTGGSPSTPGSAPAPGADAAFGHGFGVYVDDDLLHQATWALWYGGLLCFTLGGDDSPLDLPIPLDTGLLNLLAPGQFGELFPTAAPLTFVTRPAEPPTAAFAGEHTVDVAIDGLGLDLYADLDGRQTRVAGFALAADLGVDLAFDGTTGELAAGLDLPPGAVTAALVFNDLKPDASASLGGALSGLLDTLVGPLVGSLASDLAFPLPAFSGLGLTSLTLRGAGPTGDHLGAYAGLGPVAYGNEGGCDEGCSGGCGQAGAGLSWAPVGLLWLARRRRSA